MRRGAAQHSVARKPRCRGGAAGRLGLHDELFRATGNGRLAQSYDNLRAQSGLALQKMRQYSVERTRQAVSEHLDIYAAIEAHDPDAAQQRMWRHLSSAFEARLTAQGAIRTQYPGQGDHHA